MTLDAFLSRFSLSLSEGTLWGFAVAFVAGIVASAVCPCTLPVGFGMAGVAGESESRTRKSGFLIALSFFAGIVVNLTVLGAVAGRLGAVLTESFGRYWTLTMALMSLAAAGVAFRGPRLKVSELSSLRRPGLLGAFLYGFLFSLGTSAAPLFLLLTVAVAKGSPLYGIALAFVFGLGRGLPFLFVGIFSGALVRLTSFGQWRRALQVLSGSALLAVSAYYLRAFVALL